MGLPHLDMRPDHVLRCSEPSLREVKGFTRELPGTQPWRIPTGPPHLMEREMVGAEDKVSRSTSDLRASTSECEEGPGLLPEGQPLLKVGSERNAAAELNQREPHARARRWRSPGPPALHVCQRS